MDCGYSLEPPRRGGGEAVLMCTHNLCFRAKIRKIGISLQTPVLLYKSGVLGVFIARTCSPDVIMDVLSTICSSGEPEAMVCLKLNLAGINTSREVRISLY